MMSSRDSMAEAQPASALRTTGQRPAQRPGAQRRWTLQYALAVLGLQAIFFVGVIVWSLLSSDWVSGWRWEWLDLKLEIAALAAAHYVIIFVPLALLAGAAIVLVWLRPHAGWLFAMAVQCVVLFLSLEIYFIERADDIIDLPVLYLMMFGAVLIVIFLNSPEGRLLLVRSTSPREQAHGETRT